MFLDDFVKEGKKFVKNVVTHFVIPTTLSLFLFSCPSVDAPEPTSKPTYSPTPTVTATATPQPTPIPTPVPSPTYTLASTPIPTVEPTPFSTEIPTPIPTEAPTATPFGYDYTTNTEIVASKNINEEGGLIEVINSDSFLQGSSLAIPNGALNSDTTINIAEVNNPPALPNGLGYIGSAMNLEPDEIDLNLPATVMIPYNDEFLSDAGISDDTNLELYSYDISSRNWTKIDTFSLDTSNNTIIANINHFSYYAITCLNAIPPDDLGTPKPGDLLYTVGAFWDEGNPLFFNNWMPGHVGIYTGEKIYPGTGLASDEVKEFGRYNVIEALWDGVQYSYYDFPNITEPFESSLNSFNGGNLYMGAREPKDCSLTSQQRLDIVSYAEAQIGKPYAKIETTMGALFGMARGSLVKGDFGSFNCVGLAEKAYEIAGVNNGEGLTTLWQEEVGAIGLPAALTPAEQYNATKPAENIYIENRGPAGGWIFYDKGNYTKGWRYLEAAPYDLTPRKWGTYGLDVPETYSKAIGKGKQNTLEILKADPAPNKAADECFDLIIFYNNIYFDDWFLPSAIELQRMDINLHDQGIGNFSGNLYWTSCQNMTSGGTKAWYLDFDKNSNASSSKNSIYCIRAVRYF